MKRRDFIAGLSSAAAYPLVARAQQQRRIPVAGVLWNGSAETEQSSLHYHWVHDDFAAAGYIDGKTIHYEERYASGRAELQDQFADELVRLGCDILIALGTPAALALKKATSRIAIVFMGVADPVGSGLVNSIARPGGNVTGMFAVPPEVYFKRVAIMKELVPALDRLALIANLDELSHATIEREFYANAARANSIQLNVFAAHDQQTVDEAFSKIVQAGCNGVIVANQAAFYFLQDELSRAALSARLPSMGPSEVFVSSGLLISYSANFKENVRKLVDYAIRILEGAQPADLPVQLATRMEMSLNRKTAAALGLTIPPTVLVMADRVIE